MSDRKSFNLIREKFAANDQTAGLCFNKKNLAHDNLFIFQMVWPFQTKLHVMQGKEKCLGYLGHMTKVATTTKYECSIKGPINGLVIWNEVFLFKG